MAELKYDPRNYRIHTDKNKRLIKKSLEDCGTGRSILLDKNDVIIAGNGVYEQALELGLKVRIVESDGNELISWQADKAYSSVVISCSDVTKGQTYTVTGGSSSVQVTMDSLVYSESLGMGGNMSSPGNMGGQGGGPGGMKREGYL